MSTITVTQKSETPRILNNRSMVLVILTALMLMLIALAAASTVSPAGQPFDYNAYMLYRQGEWVSAPISSAHAYEIFRRGEVASPVTNAEAYQLYRQGERSSVSVPATDLTPYHLSERTWIDPQAGLEVYQQSERTRIPVLFNPYQRSEWFGE